MAIGNNHLMRHSEVNQVPVIDVDQVDYLFHRLFAVIQLVPRKKELPERRRGQQALGGGNADRGGFVGLKPAPSDVG
ncbi:MAG: hypothetical protein H6948_14490 [Zoogloeaceae bacterium]|nr:hypothetical protein [Zoogloeaceae bacterium]